MANLYAIPTEDIEDWWPAVFSLVKSALERGYQKESPQDIKRALLLQDAQLWVCIDGTELKAVIVSQICTHPSRKTCRLKIVTGYDREEWEMNLSIIEEWAKSIGCKSMELIARPGWKRILKDYDMTHVVLEKEL